MEASRCNISTVSTQQEMIRTSHHYSHQSCSKNPRHVRQPQLLSLALKCRRPAYHGSENYMIVIRKLLSVRMYHKSDPQCQER